MALPFLAPPRTGSDWFFAGLESSFPEVTSGDGRLAELRLCDRDLKSGCKVFHVPRINSSRGTEVELDDQLAGTNLKDQVLVFKYSGKFHAVDHQCPHSSYPLSNGTPFDIEDFGIVLSAGIRCPRHDWSFDLHSGQADRGSYRLAVWEVQLRPLPEPSGGGDSSNQSPDQEVWVRRKGRIG
ncbi:hypothetical protein GQ53DRAFT_740825 [Thozetella sp. PMI_491]|nr:hypothetical protein GQ53DRAFT_740825 [Thozetella sp. PMI_491]